MTLSSVEEWLGFLTGPVCMYYARVNQYGWREWRRHTRKHVAKEIAFGVGVGVMTQLFQGAVTADSLLTAVGAAIALPGAYILLSALYWFRRAPVELAAVQEAEIARLMPLPELALSFSAVPADGETRTSVHCNVTNESQTDDFSVELVSVNNDRGPAVLRPLAWSGTADATKTLHRGRPYAVTVGRFQTVMHQQRRQPEWFQSSRPSFPTEFVEPGFDARLMPMTLELDVIRKTDGESKRVTLGLDVDDDKPRVRVLP